MYWQYVRHMLHPDGGLESRDVLYGLLVSNVLVILLQEGLWSLLDLSESGGFCERHVEINIVDNQADLMLALGRRISPHSSRLGVPLISTKRVCRKMI